MGGIDQKTAYIYGQAVSSRWVTKIEYPDKTSGDASTNSGNDVSLTYNHDGKVATRTDQYGSVLTYEYAELRRTTQQRVTTLGSRGDGAVRRIATTFDTAGRTQKVTQHENDAAGRRTATIDPRSSRTEYTFDAASQLTQVKVDAGTGKLNLTTAYAYDAAGRRTQVTNPRGTATQYTYNELDRVTKVTQDYGTNKLNYYTFYTYDANGNRTVQTDANAKSTNWAYDDANRNTTVTDANSKVTTTAYDAAGNP